MTHDAEPVVLPPSRWPVYLGIGFEGGLILLAMGLGWLFGQRPWSTVQWNLTGTGFGILAAGPMVAGLLLLSRSSFPPIQRILQLFEEIGPTFFQSYNWIDLALLSLAAGFGEELLFRAMAQGALTQWLGPWFGVVLASLVFGLMHAITPTYAFLASLAGVYLGVLWVVTGNLLVVILAHSLYDFVALTYLLRKARRSKSR